MPKRHSIAFKNKPNQYRPRCKTCQKFIGNNHSCINAMQGKTHDSKTREYISQRTKQLMKEKNMGPYLSEKQKISSNRPEVLAKNREAHIKLWLGEDSIYRQPQAMENRIKGTLKGLLKRPTSLEKGMIELINKHNLPYKYTGNGTFLIGYRNPDFINTEGKKICIEIGNVYHHQGDYEKKRKEHFAKYGWETIVFIMDKIDEDKIMGVLGQNG